MKSRRLSRLKSEGSSLEISSPVLLSDTMREYPEESIKPINIKPTPMCAMAPPACFKLLVNFLNRLRFVTMINIPLINKIMRDGLRPLKKKRGAKTKTKETTTAGARLCHRFWREIFFCQKN